MATAQKTYTVSDACRTASGLTLDEVTADLDFASMEEADATITTLRSLPRGAAYIRFEGVIIRVEMLCPECGEPTYNCQNPRMRWFQCPTITKRYLCTYDAPACDAIATAESIRQIRAMHPGMDLMYIGAPREGV